MSVLVITGTSTDVGKTVVTAALAAAAMASGRTVCVCKPVQTGVQDDEPGDAREAGRLSGAPFVELVRYPDPLAPVVAAGRCGRRLLTLAELVASVEEMAQDRLVLVEGAGGVLVRLGAQDVTLIDLASELRAPMVVVTSAELGTLNHTELTVNAIRAAQVDVAGLVVGRWPARPQLAHMTNLAMLGEFPDVPMLGKIPDGAGVLRPEEFQGAASRWFNPSTLSRLWLETITPDRPTLRS